MSEQLWNRSLENELDWFSADDPTTYPRDGEQVRVRFSNGMEGPGTFFSELDGHFSLFDLPWGETAKVVSWAKWPWKRGLTFTQEHPENAMLYPDEVAQLGIGDEAYAWSLVERPGRRFQGVLIANPGTGLHSCKIKEAPLRASLEESKRAVDAVVVGFVRR